MAVCASPELRIEDVARGVDVRAAQMQSVAKGLNCLEKRAVQFRSSAKGSSIPLRFPFYAVNAPELPADEVADEAPESPSSPGKGTTC
jgi:hypothetical protein